LLASNVGTNWTRSRFSPKSVVYLLHAMAVLFDSFSYLKLKAFVPRRAIIGCEQLIEIL
jgi:hypothetical protein